jgi:glutamate/aspartate transport system substrate-binding protein
VARAVNSGLPVRVRAALLVACSLGMAGLMNGAWAAGQSPTLQKIQQTGLIVLGYREGAVPFSYLDESQQPVGYTIDLCQRVVTQLKTRIPDQRLRVKYVPVLSATRIPMVMNGTVDLECGITTNTVERQRSVSFSVTTYVALSRFVSKRSTPIQRVAELAGRTVVSTVSTTSLTRLRALNDEGLNMTLLAGRDDADSFHMLDTDRAVAYAMDDVLLRSFIAVSRHPEDYVLSTETLSVEPYAIAMRKGDPVFKQMVDSALAQVFASGEIHALYEKWFMKPLPGVGINLQIPMSSALARVIEQPTDTGDPAAYMDGLKAIK